MFKKLLGAVGLGTIAAGAPMQSAQAQAAEPPPAAATLKPYADATSMNTIYSLLFCDDLADFRPLPGAALEPWQSLLFGPQQDAAKIAELAADTGAESRVRAIAFTWLRAHGQDVPKRILLGVILEVPLDGGLDVLAAYPDGSVRYINQSGKLIVIEPGGMPNATQATKRLIELSEPIVVRLGPWDKPRRPPPIKPNVRITFVVSDGLYFGEGPFDVMQRDPLAGPLLFQGTQLLKVLTETARAK